MIAAGCAATSTKSRKILRTTQESFERAMLAQLHPNLFVHDVLDLYLKAADESIHSLRYSKLGLAPF